MYTYANQRKIKNIFSRKRWEYSKRKVIEIVSDLDIKIIDISDIYANKDSEKYFHNTESHFNSSGNEFLAKEIFLKIN